MRRAVLSLNSRSLRLDLHFPICPARRTQADRLGCRLPQRHSRRRQGRRIRRRHLKRLPLHCLGLRSTDQIPSKPLRRLIILKAILPRVSYPRLPRRSRARVPCLLRRRLGRTRPLCSRLRLSPAHPFPDRLEAIRPRSRRCRHHHLCQRMATAPDSHLSHRPSPIFRHCRPRLRQVLLGWQERRCRVAARPAEGRRQRPATARPTSRKKCLKPAARPVGKFWSCQELKVANARHACPASLTRCERSIPIFANALEYLLSRSSSKMMSGSAGQFNQPFAWSSVSSCPGDQPA
jgi:hypothetical protein